MKLTMNQFILSFDVESNGLHGAAFAIGAVQLNWAGDVCAQFAARCPVVGAVDPWVAEHVIPALATLPETHPDARSMRDAFWSWLQVSLSIGLVVVDCGWPVEGNLLSACIADDPGERAFKGPYPLHEVATLLFAAGMDPMKTYGPELLPDAKDSAHHPVYDAHVSALCARMALVKLGLATPAGEPL